MGRTYYTVKRYKDPFAPGQPFHTFRHGLPSEMNKDRLAALYLALPASENPNDFEFGVLEGDRLAAVTFDGDRFIVVYEDPSGRRLYRVRIPNPPGALSADAAANLLKKHIPVTQLLDLADVDKAKERKRKEREAAKRERQTRRNNRRRLQRRIAKHLRQTRPGDRGSN